ncbi:MAG: family 1 encapsulin nanocompartment shell protein [Methanotrichaceae archaeon]
MDNKFLGREDAPIGPEVWDILDKTMVEAAKSVLTGRRILHIEGPFGLGLKAIPMPDTKSDGGLITSSFMPVNMVQKMFLLSKRDIAASEREGLSINTSVVANAAIEVALLEDSLIFNGSTGLTGLMNASGSKEYKLSSWDAIGKAADEIIGAVTLLDKAGLHGPYTMALAPNRYNLLLRRFPQGGTELEHLQTIVTDGIYKAPILEHGGILLASGVQYASIMLGQDMAVGFIGPVAEDLEFSISESLALMIREPKAICVLK